MEEVVRPKRSYTFLLYFVLVYALPSAVLVMRFVQPKNYNFNTVLAVSAGALVALCFIAIQEYKIFPHKEEKHLKLFFPLAINIVISLVLFGVNDLVRSMTSGFVITLAASMISLAAVQLKRAKIALAKAHENVVEFNTPFLQEYWKKKARTRLLGDELVNVLLAFAAAAYTSYTFLYDELVQVDTTKKIVLVVYFIFSVLSVVWSQYRQTSAYEA